MADVNLTVGGPYRVRVNGLAPHSVYGKEQTPPACRVGGEYMHGFFTVGNSFNPMFSEGQADAVDMAQVSTGDFIKLFVIPGFHTLVDVAVHTVPVQSERGYPGKPNSDGFAVTFEARRYDANTLQELGTVELVSDMSGIMPNETVYKRSAVKPTEGGYFIPKDEFIVLGLKVDGVPTDAKIHELTSRVEISAHVWDYEVPMHV